MNTASQLIQSNEEVKCAVVTDRISNVLLLSVVQVFKIGLIFIHLCKEKAVQLYGLNLGSVQE